MNNQINRRITPSHDKAHDNAHSKAHITTVSVLSPGQYKQLVSKLPRPIPKEGATPQEVGYLLGIQHALAIIQEGFTAQ
jgi:hypothetical protein